jgi:glycosyltransferase involved in cell wall biosynthesis
MSLVTLVIPAYNASAWIRETLESVHRQTYQHIEIVVVDDGSTDHTMDIAEATLRRGRFPYRVVRQDNNGPSSARNRGWRAGRGIWVQFLDADDLIRPDKIELQMAYESSAADVIYSDWQRLCWTGEAWENEKYAYTPMIGENALADLLRNGNFIALGSQLFRSSVLQCIGGFDETHTLTEDVELHLKIAMRKGIFVKAPSDGPMFWYRDRVQSLSKSDRTKFVESCFRNAKLVEEHLRRTQSWSAEIVEGIVSVYSQSARYFAEHDRKRFEEIVTDIEALDPAFLPNRPPALRGLSRLMGYRRAERASVLYRKLKKLAFDGTAR